MNARPLAYCLNCDDKKEYFVKAQKREITVKGLTFQYVHQTAYCTDCGEELYSPEINDYNVQAKEDAYRKAAQLITVSELKEILKKYNIGAGPLARIMGVGDVTVNRYLCGRLPSKDISTRLLDLYASPVLMDEFLEKNRTGISSLAYQKCRATLDKLLQIYSDDKINVVTRYLLGKSGDITPLALQKLLYYAQAFFFALFNTELFLTPCQAWLHGPVYPEIYNQFKEYGADPLQCHTESFVDHTCGLTDNEMMFLDSIIDVFGRFSGSFLRNLTHKEAPWKEARGDLSEEDKCSAEISRESIHRYFAEVVDTYHIQRPEDMIFYVRAMTA